MKAINSEQKTLKTELSAVSAEFKGQEDSAAALTAKNKILQQSYQNNKDKVEALEKQLAAANKAYPEGGAQVDKYRQQLAKAKDALEKSKNALSENTEALKKQGPAARTLSTALHNAGGAIDDFVMDARIKFPKATAALDAVTASFSKLGTAAGKGIKLSASAVKTGSETMIKGLGALATAGAAGATAIGALAVTGFKTLADYATQAAKDGNPAFASLAENLTELDSASSAAKAALGTVLLPALETLSSKGAALLTDFTAAMEGANGDTEQMGRVMSEYIKKAVDLARETLPEFLQLGGDLLSGLGEGIIDNLPELLADAEVMITQLLDGVEANADKLGDSAATLITTLGLSLVKNAPKLLSSGLRIVLALVEGVLDAIPELAASVPQLIEEFKTAFEEQAPHMLDIGSRIVNGIWDGIKAGWDKVTGWVGNAIGKLTGSVSVSGGADGTHAGGLPYVPFDGYRAILHEGERVLTRHEAQDYRSGENKNSNTVNATVNIMELTEVQKARLFEQFNDWLGDQT